MKIVYLAGAYRAKDWNGMWDNIMKARSAARELWKMGLVCICPHLNTALMDGEDILAGTFLNGDLEILRRCDAIFMLRGFEHSQGAMQEWALAKELNLPVIYQDDNQADNIVELMNIKHSG